MYVWGASAEWCVVCVRAHTLRSFWMLYVWLCLEEQRRGVLPNHSSETSKSLAPDADGEKSGAANDPGTVIGEAPLYAMLSVPCGFGKMLPTTSRCKRADCTDEMGAYSKMLVIETCPLHS